MDEKENNLNNNISDFDLMRQELLKNPQPNTNYETAVFLLKNSDLTKDLSEIEKEIKLSNIDEKEKKIILSLLNSYQDQLLLEEMHLRKYESALMNSNNKELSEEQISELINIRKYFETKKFDKTNHLKRALTIATTSRGYKGFERESQIKTIQTTTMNTSLEQQNQRTGFMNKIFGGLR